MDRRILLLLTDLNIGGTPTVVRELAGRLHQPPRVNIHVACLDRSGPVAEQIRQRNIPVTSLDARGATDWRVVSRLIQLIHREKFDTVFSFLVHANAVAALASLRCPGVHFFQSIQTTQRRPKWHWWVQRLAQRTADKIAVPSPSVADAAVNWSSLAKEKIVVIPNAVDLPASLPAPAPIQNPRRVVFLGRLDPVKRIPDLVQAMTLLGASARLDIYGEGPLRSELERQIEQLDLSSSVTLHGAVASPDQALGGADILVLPSQAEGFGLVLIEAMAAGVAVVATDVPGIRDVVIRGQTGLLVPPNSPSALATAIKSLLDDENLRRSLIAAAWKDARSRFTWDVALDGYRRLLRI